MMLPLFWKKSQPAIPPLKGFTDWHSHILPGVDDGVRDIDETLAILQQYENRGVAEVWFTPHIMEDIPNRTDLLRERFDEVAKAYSGNVGLHLGSENMLDNLFEERLEANDLLPIGADNGYLLVETSYFNPPLGMKETLKRIADKGYTPLLAHPERYLYMDKKDYSELMEDGVLFQLNMLSFSGYYGKEVREKARWLYEKCDNVLFGTDLHNIKMLDWLQNK